MLTIKLRQKPVIVELNNQGLVDHGIDLPQVFVGFRQLKHLCYAHIRVFH